MKVQFKCTALAASLLLFMPQSQSLAQATKPKSAPVAPTLWGAKPKKNDGVTKKLKAEIPLPNIPTFSGQKLFKRGTINDTSRGQSISETFSVTRTTTAEILAWYRQVLQAKPWAVTVDTNYVIGGLDADGNTFSALTQSSSLHPDRSQLMLTYFAPAK